MQELPLARQTLGVQWATSPRTESRWRKLLRRSTSASAPASRYLDWTVDGEAIGDWFANERNPRYGVTWLVQGDNDPDMIEASLLALLGERHPELDAEVRFADGRVAVLFCPLCGDLACGAISAELHFTDDAVEWRALNYQDGLTGDVWTHPPQRTVSFDRHQYEAAIGELLRDWVKRA